MEEIEKSEELVECEEPQTEQEKQPETELNADMLPSKPKRPAVRTPFLVLAVAVVFFFVGAFAAWSRVDKQLLKLMDVKRAIDDHYYKEISDDAFYDALVDTINNKVLDPYSMYMTADEYSADKDSMAGKRIGIGGVFSTMDKNKKPHMLVTRICGNSPSEAAGMLAGDYVTAFGKDQNNLTESVNFDDFSDFLQTCAEGEVFFVRVRRGAEDKILTMSREEYKENYLFYRTSTKAYAFTGKKADTLEEHGAPLSCLAEDTAYIRLTQFGGSVSEQFGDLMDLFKEQGKKHLVLDLRGNGGGYLDVMQNLAQYFCKNSTDKKPIAVLADYGDRQHRYKAAGNVYYDYFAADSRICILADAGTASASECLIGCMVDYGATAFSDICLIERNGVAKTYGKGIMQATYMLGLDGDVIRLTSAEIYWPVSNRTIHDRGVLPEDGARKVSEKLYGDEEIVAALTELNMVQQ